MNGAATLELTFFAMIVAIVVGVIFGLLAGRFRDTPDRRRRPAVRDRHLRDAGLLPRADGAALLRLVPRLAADLGPREPDHRRRRSRPTRTSSLIDTIIDRNWDAFKDVVKHLILPAVTLGLVTAGVFIRLVRVNVIRTMKDDYIEAARARGIDERSVVYHHAFRNALVPVITDRRPDGRAAALGAPC